MLLLVCVVIGAVGTLVWTGLSLGDAARMPGLSTGARIGWFAVFLAGPLLALAVGGILGALSPALSTLGAIFPSLWLPVALWAFLLLVRRPRLGLGAEAFRVAWRESGVVARRAWTWHAALGATLLVAAVIGVPMIERAFRDSGAMMPAPTQLLIDGSVELRNSGWWTAPLLLPLAYLTYRLHGMLLRVGRASATPSAVYAALTNAALALVLVLFAAACALPIFGLHSRIR